MLPLNHPLPTRLVLPPSHPETVLTKLSYFEKSLTELRMKTSNLSADMQLYIVATLIKWASHGNRFKSVIIRPGGMHTLMSFNGCIGNIMKASGLKVLESIKCGVTIGDKTLYDMASLFCRLITVGQHRQVELQTLFDYLTMNCALFLHQSLMNMDV